VNKACGRTLCWDCLHANSSQDNGETIQPSREGWGATAPRHCLTQNPHGLVQGIMSLSFLSYLMTHLMVVPPFSLSRTPSYVRSRFSSFLAMGFLSFSVASLLVAPYYLIFH
jgi:hypothetical protein